MKNIAVCLNVGSPPKRNAITSMFSDKKWAYWHWIDDFWIVQVPDEFTPRLLHTLIESLPEVGTATILLFEFKGSITYWGRAEEAAWDWLKHIGGSG